MVKELQALETLGVQKVMDVLSEVTPHIAFAQIHLRRPLRNNFLETLRLEAVIARLLKDIG